MKKTLENEKVRGKNGAQKVFSLGALCSFQYNIIDQYQFGQNNIIAVLFKKLRLKIHFAFLVDE